MSGLANRLSLWQSEKLPMIRQTEAAECGLACLAMVAAFHGYQSTLVELRQKFSLSLNGCTLLDLMNFAERLSLSSRPLRLELEQLAQLRKPCILHWDLNHFVVLKSVSKHGCVIHDPAYGERKLSLDEVSKHFTGIALELLPVDGFELKQGQQKLGLSHFWSKITGLKRSLTLLFLLSILLQIFTIAAPYYMQLVVDDVILTHDVSLLVVLAIGFFLLLLFDVMTSAVRSFVLLHFGSLLNIQMTANLFHHLIRLPLAYFEKRHIGDVVSRFGSLKQVRELLTAGMVEALIDGLMAIAIFGVILFYSPQLSVVVCVAVLIYAVFRLAMYRSLHQVSEQEILAQAKENTNFMETMRAMQTIKLFGAEVKREGLWQNYFVDVTNKAISIGVFNLTYTSVNRLLFGIENIVVIYLAALLVLDGSFSTGMLFAFITYKAQFLDRMARLIEKFIQYKMLSLHFDRLSDIALTNKEPIHQDAISDRVVNGSLEVRNLEFRYSDASPWVVQHTNLRIEAGESVVLVGPSGCGKTTLMKLMLGLLQPQAGEILVDGQPINKFGLQNYRRQLAAVMQDDQLLSGTIRDNITFFAEQPDESLMLECAKLAAIDQDIQQMAMGYNSLIGDMGSALSGGQKQRLLLARALYRQPKIIFLDEATSHLDIKTEFSVSEAIKGLKITRVVIAHRPETIASADRIIRLGESAVAFAGE
jgi:ATP-binding cassette subfamily B protein RaxB